MTHSSRTTRWLASLGVLLAFLVIAVIAIWLLKLTGSDRAILLIGLALLGAAGAALTWHLMRPTDAVTRAEKDDAILALRQAADRLPRGELLRKSLVLVIGPPTSTKTTVVTRSGLDAQLLAGDARGTGPEESTKAANIWLAGGGAVVESPGALTSDSGRFTRFVRALRAPGLAVALGRREPAPRAIVLCIPCDYLATADEAKQLDALAPTIRDRLADAALHLGMRVPVYVLFTRFDKIPYVETWLAPLTREETRVPMGAALPFDNGAAGAYAERLVPRLEQAFSQLITSLSVRRSELLTRESVESRRLTSYEVPREMSKLAPAVIRFLVEVTRPSQMGMTPQLRGFWFSGARPVLVRDAAPEAASIPAPAAGATGLFRPGMQLDAAAAAPTAARKVPEWVFIDRFFTDVVFGDRSGHAAALGGVRVSGIRRILLGSAIGVGLLLSTGVLVSWLGNRSLTSRTLTAARAVASLPIVQAAPGTIALPSGEALRTLEQLRSLIDSIATIDSAGAPFTLGFGLWNGKGLIASARPAWVAGYRRQLHDDAWRSLTDSLRAVPAVPLPTSDYGRTYDMLKTYLVGSSEHAKSSSSFVTPVLLAAWQRGIATDTAVTELARKQFDTYASMQTTEALWPVTGDLQLVGHARGHLNQFAGIDPIYVSMLSTVSSNVKPLRLTDSVPQAAGVVGAAGAIIRGPFTSAGWRSMQDVLKNSDRFFQGETWVLGDRSAVSSRNRTQDLAEIRKRYVTDYASEWRTALRAVTVPRAATVKESALRLGKLGSAQSALLNVLSIVSHNTNVDTAVARVFQPVQSVTPASVTGKFVSESNEPYANALLQLQASMEQVGSLPPATDSATASTLKLAAQNVQLGAVSQARIAARQLEQKFAVDAEASAIGRVVQALLQAPIDGAEAALQRVSNAPLPRVAAAKPAGGGGGGGGAAPPPAAASAAGVPTPAVAAPAAGAAVAAGVAASAGADFAGSASGAELAAMLNERGKQLCRSMERILRKFPFSVDQGDASVSDVNALLAPGTGALWQFYDGGLQPLLPLFNGTYSSRPTNGVTLSPQFVTFFRWMARASGALYMDKGQTPRMSLSIKALATGDAPGTVTLYHGDRTPRMVPGAEAQTVSWPPSGGSSARLTVSVGGREQELARADGPWALFRVMARATSAEGSGRTRVLTFSGAAPVALELTAPGVTPVVVYRGGLTGPACVSQVVQQ